MIPDKKKYLLAIRILFILILCIPVFRILHAHRSNNNGHIKLVYFGAEFKHRALPEVHEHYPSTVSKYGYDGQYYAQLALRPALRDPALNTALDNATIRARRIGLPFIAYCLGMGDSGRILRVYALLNVVFWCFLVFLIMYYVGCSHYRNFQLAIALLWTTGTLISITRALTDLPALVLALSAIYISRNWILSALLMACSGLTKETSILCYAAGPENNGNRSIKQLTLAILLAIIPVICWYLYLRSSLEHTSMGFYNFTWPFWGFINKLITANENLGNRIGIYNLFEIASPICILCQIIYLCKKPLLSSNLWLLGAGFIPLFIFMGAPVWEDQIGFTRILLPITFAFNLLIHKYEKGKNYIAWYFAGNIGMFWALITFPHI